MNEKAFGKIISNFKNILKQGIKSEEVLVVCEDSN